MAQEVRQRAGGPVGCIAAPFTVAPTRQPCGHEVAGAQRGLGLIPAARDERPWGATTRGGGRSRMTDEQTRTTGPLLVLVAGEREGTASWLEEVLAPNGFAVFLALNARLAIARAHATQPDVIFIEAVLPDMSGLELCRLLKEDPRVAHGTPLLARRRVRRRNEQRR